MRVLCKTSDCIRKVGALRKIAGTPGALMVVRSSENEPWRVIGIQGADSARVDLEGKDANGSGAGKDEDVLGTGVKRERESSIGAEPSAKRARVSPDAESAPCLAPPQDPRVKALLYALGDPLNGDVVEKGGKEGGSLEQVEKYLGAGDIFLTEGWRNRWCRCRNVSLP